MDFPDDEAFVEAHCPNCQAAVVEVAGVTIVRVTCPDCGLLLLVESNENNELQVTPWLDVGRN